MRHIRNTLLLTTSLLTLVSCGKGNVIETVTINNGPTYHSIGFYDETVHRHRANVNNTLDRSYYRDDRLVEKSGGHILNWTPRLKQPYSYGKLHACKCAVAIREKEECFSLRM